MSNTIVTVPCNTLHHNRVSGVFGILALTCALGYKPFVPDQGPLPPDSVLNNATACVVHRSPDGKWDAVVKFPSKSDISVPLSTPIRYLHKQEVKGIAPRFRLVERIEAYDSKVPQHSASLRCEFADLSLLAQTPAGEQYQGYYENGQVQYAFTPQTVHLGQN